VAEGRVRGYSGSVRLMPQGPLANLFQKRLWIFHHQAVRQPQHSDSEAAKICVFYSIPLHLAWLSVHAAINLHRETKFKIVEIDEIISDRKLPPELESRTAVTQEVPREFFRCGFVTLQFTSFRRWNLQEGVPPHPSASCAATLSPWRGLTNLRRRG
jgi:hypothetical protein